jgi:hypothetical protein
MDNDGRVTTLKHLRLEEEFIVSFRFPSESFAFWYQHILLSVIPAVFIVVLHHPEEFVKEQV